MEEKILVDEDQKNWSRRSPRGFVSGFRGPVLGLGSAGISDSNTRAKHTALKHALGQKEDITD